ncbi:hypothetical protein DL95DRAFT_19278 [Leptodontidium sp. 2 PMI_412]|nr:hypothetical protein DL95DRAFT_19278 [Leptodontidium sp. 2 PMI_412]
MRLLATTTTSLHFLHFFIFTSPLLSPLSPRQQLSTTTTTTTTSSTPPSTSHVCCIDTAEHSSSDISLRFCRQWCTTPADSSPRLEPIPAHHPPIPSLPSASHAFTASKYNLPLALLLQIRRKLPRLFERANTFAGLITAVEDCLEAPTWNTAPSQFDSTRQSSAHSLDHIQRRISTHFTGLIWIGSRY